MKNARGGRPQRSPNKSAQKSAQRSAAKPGQKPVAKPLNKIARPPHRESGHREAPHREQKPRDNARWVVGLHSCEEAMRVRPRGIRELWLRADWQTSQQLRDVHELATKQKISIKEKAQGQLDSIGSGHQGVAVACTDSPALNWDQLAAAEHAIIIILDGIEDPHNLGSILRTAWLTGVAALIIPTDRAVGLTPAACKIASGGAEHVPVEAEPNIGSVMERLKEAGFWIYGLAEGGTRKPWEFELGKKTAWVIGNEGSGIRKATERACDELVRIPQVASGSSYNASIACAMALSETCRQFGKPN